MAAELLVDTSGWYAAIRRSDFGHAGVSAALRERLRARSRLVTTNLVVAETHALLVRRVDRRTAQEFLSAVVTPPTVVVFSTPDLQARAQKDWLDRFSDQAFTLTDAVSFAVMAERRIREVLTLDSHFAAAGFLMVPGEG